MSTYHMSMKHPPVVVKRREDIFKLSPGSTANDNRIIFTGPMTMQGPVDIQAGHIVIPEGMMLEIKPATQGYPGGWQSGGVTVGIGGYTGFTPYTPYTGILASGVPMQTAFYSTNTISDASFSSAVNLTGVTEYAEGASYATT